MRRKTKRTRHLRGRKCVWRTLYARCRRYWCCRYREILATVRTTYYLIEHAVQFDGYFMLTKNWQEEIAIPFLSRSATSCARWAHCFTTKQTNTRTQTHTWIFSHFSMDEFKKCRPTNNVFDCGMKRVLQSIWMNECSLELRLCLDEQKKTNNNNKKIHTRLFEHFN